jgi:hypothetical protein
VVGDKKQSFSLALFAAALRSLVLRHGTARC